MIDKILSLMIKALRKPHDFLVRLKFRFTVNKLLMKRLKEEVDRNNELEDRCAMLWKQIERLSNAECK